MKDVVQGFGGGLLLLFMPSKTETLERTVFKSV